MSVFRNILEKRKAALQAELDRAEEQAWLIASASLTDEQRARGLGVLLAKVNQRMVAVADTGSAVVMLDEEDEQRVKALTALIERLKAKGLGGLVDAAAASVSAPPTRAHESPVSMPSLDRFPQEPVSGPPMRSPEPPATVAPPTVARIGEPPGTRSDGAASLPLRHANHRDRQPW